MDDVVAVGVVQRTRDFGGDAERVGDRELFLAVQPVAERLALDQRHDVEQEVVRPIVPVAARPPTVEQRQNVRMLQVRRGFDLAQKSLGADHRGELRSQHLDRDLALVLEVLGEIHRGHAALAQLPLDAVAVT